MLNVMFSIAFSFWGLLTLLAIGGPTDGRDDLKWMWLAATGKNRSPAYRKATTVGPNDAVAAPAHDDVAAAGERRDTPLVSSSHVLNFQRLSNFLTPRSSRARVGEARVSEI